MLAADAAAELEAAIARLRAVFDDRDGAARAADGIRKLAAWIPLTEEILEDAPTLRIGILLRMAGFGLARCDYGVCWWCGEPDSLFRLEGARLAGSDPLGLPSTIVTPEERDAFRVCPRCAVAFGYLRQRHDVELFEAGVLRPGSSALVDATVAAVVRRYIRELGREVDRAERKERSDAEGE